MTPISRKSIPIGEVMRAGGCGIAKESTHPKYKPGDQLTGMFGFQMYFQGSRRMLCKVPCFRPL